ncbi:MAG: LysR family transcriptional regulator [Pseudomonadota bacterium]
MLDEIRQIAIFAKAVEHGSFRGAARALDISPSVVSHHIAKLEERLGVALLYRSTRSISLTEDGARLLESAQVMIDAAQAGLHSLAHRGNALTGLVRITLPGILAQSVVTDRLVNFAREHPGLELELDYSDSVRELISSGFDLAIRMGKLEDSALKMRKLNEFARIVIASPVYMEERKPPETPGDLAELDWIGLSQVPLKPKFVHPSENSVRLKPEPAHTVNNALALLQMVRSGAGIGILPDCITGIDIESGRIQQLLSDWRLDPIGVYALWPPNAPKAGLALRLVDYLVDQSARSRSKA